MPDEELKRQFDAIQQDGAAMRQENAAAHAETRRNFRETADRLAAENRHYFDVAAEATRNAVGLSGERVTLLDEKLTREAADIREEMRRGFADTQAMIKF